MRRTLWTAITACGLAGAAWGQTGAASLFNPLSANQNGVHLYGVSLYSGYYSAGTPAGVGIPGVPFSPPASTDHGTNAFGAAATFGWSKVTDHVTLSASYSPSYFGTVQNSDYNQLNHGFSFSATRKMRKWTVNFGAAGVMANMEQLFFSPTALSSAAGVPATFDDLAAALLTGKMTDPQLASILTGASLLNSPDQTFYYGSRVLSASMQAGVSWAASGRSSFQFSVAASRLQRLHRARELSSSPAAVLPQTTAGSGSFGWSYSISPRTQFGLSAGSSRTFSRYQQGYSTTASISLGRTMSRRWFTQVSAGAGKMIYTRNTFSVPQRVQFQGGGSVGFKTWSHTLLASYGRSVGDIYGLGSTSTNSATGAWSWHGPGSGWSVSAFFGYQWLDSPVFTNTQSWYGGASLGRALGAHMFTSLQYVYSRLPSRIEASRNSDQSGVIVSLTWTPSTYR